MIAPAAAMAKTPTLEGSGTVNHVCVCGELRKKSIIMFATFVRPLIDG